MWRTLKHFLLFAVLQFGGFALNLMLLVHAQDQSGFIETNESKVVILTDQQNKMQPYWSLRVFPQGTRNCYKINVTRGTKYLIRASFLYGNYDDQYRLPEFQLHLGPNLWDSVKLENASTVANKELIHVPLLNYIHVCLVDTNKGVPFISAIELRTLPNKTYVAEAWSLALDSWYDTGQIANSKQLSRYPDDIYDRFWYGYDRDEWTQLNTSSSINTNNTYQPSSAVMTTAATPKNVDDSLNIFWLPSDNSGKYYIYMHFAEVEKLQGNESRQLNITTNGEPYFGPFAPDYLSHITSKGIGKEIPAALKFTHGKELVFKWINRGDISKYIQSHHDTNFGFIEQQINGINSRISVSPAKVNHLKVGQKQSHRFCSKRTHSKKEGWVSIIQFLRKSKSIRTSPLRTKEETPYQYSPTEMKKNFYKNEFLESQGQRFTYSEIVKITNNFASIIGRGGFGKVYLGALKNKTQVAVKLLGSSRQGSNEFRNEVILLMSAHHRNLVSLIGYCDEGDTMALVYDYVANGNLEQHISSDVGKNVLTWKERLQISVDAARGLEYLHNGCKPPIVHRDLKTSNILLNEKLQAKIADFGLSKGLATESAIHVSTAAKGTFGYLDPEYCSTGQLNKKSDIYSFGIVLLEFITGRAAIIRDLEQLPIHICQWVRPKFEKIEIEIESIVDSRIQGTFLNSSAKKSIEIAMACVSSTSIQRPDITVVFNDLKECLETEMPSEITKITEAYESDDTISSSGSIIKTSHIRSEAESNPISW
ncbi:PREDICTED: probable LRR receptor [Prunus dulcis]|uniref:PREDICTED: probable LRR receptor n=1 Tax=Prunus dulcis TaxID=3755 RepID=A0A5E4F8L3_PRUDU|nr:PREDICTED: probable LRR receptor [Prunus dulcis]